MNIKRGDIVFVMNQSIVSKTIRIVTTGRINQIVPSHIAIVENATHGSIALLEANFGGVRRLNLNPAYTKYKLWIGRMKDPRDIEKGLEWAQDVLGLKYDYTAIIGLWTRSFFRILGKKAYHKIRFVRNFLDSKQRFFCSEYVSKYGIMTGEELWPHPDSETTPYDLFRSNQIDIIEKVR